MVSNAAGMASEISQKGIMYSNRAVEASRLKILGHDFRKVVIRRIGPEVRIKPWKSIRRCPAQGCPNELVGGIENGELEQ